MTRQESKNKEPPGLGSIEEVQVEPHHSPSRPTIMMYIVEARDSEVGLGGDCDESDLEGGNGVILLGSRRAHEILLTFYNGYRFGVEECEFPVSGPEFTSTVGQRCHLSPSTWPPIPFKISFSACDQSSSMIYSTPRSRQGLFLNCPGRELEVLDLNLEFFQEPFIIAGLCFDHSCWRRKSNGKTIAMTAIDDDPTFNPTMICAEHCFWERRFSIMISGLFEGSISDFPLELLQLCFSLLQIESSNNELFALACVCRRWNSALHYHRTLACRTTHEDGWPLGDLLLKAVSLESTAVFVCKGLKRVILHPGMWEATRFLDPIKIWASVATLFRLSNLDYLDVTGPLSFSGVSLGQGEILALRSQAWETGLGRHNLGYLALRWMTRGQSEALNLGTYNGEHRWCLDDVLGLLPHCLDWMEKYLLEGINFRSSLSTLNTARSIRELALVDCRMNQHSLSTLIENVAIRISLHIERCVGPGRLNVRDVSELFKSLSGGELLSLKILFWPWADPSFHDNVFDRWIEEQRTQAGTFGFMPESVSMHRLTSLEIDGTCQGLGIFSPPLAIDPSFPNLRTIKLHYCSGLQVWDVLAIIDGRVGYLELDVTVFVGDWATEEIAMVEQKIDKREWAGKYIFSEGSSAVEEEWESHQRKDETNWGIEEELYLLVSGYGRKVCTKSSLLSQVMLYNEKIKSFLKRNDSIKIKTSTMVSSNFHPT